MDTAKLVVTFATGISATMVATGLQVGPTRLFDGIGCACLGLSLVATVATALLDRLAEPDCEQVLALAVVHHWSDYQLTQELRAQLLGVVKNNRVVVDMVMCAATAAVILALSGGIFSTLSLFGAGT